MFTDLFSSGPWPVPTLVESAGRPLAVVSRDGVTMATIAEVFDAAFPAVPLAADVAGPAVAIYEGDPSSTFRLQAGFPVPTALPGPLGSAPRVEPAQFPAGPLLVLTHIGGYDALSRAWATLMQAVNDAGHTPSALWGEIYVTAPTPEMDPATLRTDIWITLRA